MMAVVSLGFHNPGSAVTLSPPLVQSNAVSFFFDSVPDQLFTVQSASSPSGGWLDEASYPGTGAQILFSAPVTEDQRFFRVRSTAFEPLELSPATPVLADGPVSLPDAVAGAPYLESVVASPTGFPPYTLQVDGSPPDGVTLEITGNETANASVRIVSTGAGLVPGQRRRFALTAIDGLNATITREYDLRVVAPPPQIAPAPLVLKAGEATHLTLTANGGTEPLAWSLVSGSLPEGMSLSADGLLSGTPTADAAEMNEDGRYESVIEVSDSFTDRLTGAPSPRGATGSVQTLVRLSYMLNIRATRENGPSLLVTCVGCHGSFFRPDVVTGTALALIHVSSQPGFPCETSGVYVTPGNTTDSLIYQKLGANPPCGEQMPQGGPYLSDPSRERLGRWIRELTESDTD